jgi:hypothetical protein
LPTYALIAIDGKNPLSLMLVSAGARHAQKA